MRVVGIVERVAQTALTVVAEQMALSFFTVRKYVYTTYK